MNKYKIKRNFVIATCILAMLLSCNDDVQIMKSTATLINLEATKEWFESQAEININEKILPRWDKARIYQHAIEMPYTVNGKLEMPFSEYGLKHQGRKRILIMNNGKEYSAHLISYNPSPNFTGDIKKIQASNFIRSFEGEVTIGPLDRSFENELEVKNNKVTAKRTLSARQAGQNARVQEFVQQCTNWFQWDGHEWNMLDPTCDTWWEYEWFDPFSYWTPTDIYWPWYSDVGYSGGAGFYIQEPIYDYWLYCINNQLQNPCLSGVADKVLDPELVSTYNKLIQEIFNSSDKVNLILQEGQLPSDKTAATDPLNQQDGVIGVTVTLDPSKLVGGSKEFIGATIYHECFHAIIKFLSNGNYSSDDQHIAMFTSYLYLLASSLESAYPGMQPGDAKGLILIGLIALDDGPNPRAGYWATDFVDKVLSKTGFSRFQVDFINNRYQIMKTSGTNCN